MLAVGTLLSCGLSCANLLRPFLLIYRMDPFLAVLVVLCVLGGVVSLERFSQFVSNATELYYVSLLLGNQVLSEYTDRLRPEQREAFQRVFYWELIGFGLPLYAAAKLIHPVVLVARLQLVQAASAELVVHEAALSPALADAGLTECSAEV